MQQPFVNDYLSAGNYLGGSSPPKKRQRLNSTNVSFNSNYYADSLTDPFENHLARIGAHGNDIGEALEWKEGELTAPNPLVAELQQGDGTMRKDGDLNGSTGMSDCTADNEGGALPSVRDRSTTNQAFVMRSGRGSELAEQRKTQTIEVIKEHEHWSLHTTYLFQWTLQAAAVLRREISTFFHPSQISNLTLASISNQLIGLMAWFGLNVEEQSSFSLLSSLETIAYRCCAKCAQNSNSEPNDSASMIFIQTSPSTSTSATDSVASLTHRSFKSTGNWRDSRIDCLIDSIMKTKYAELRSIAASPSISSRKLLHLTLQCKSDHALSTVHSFITGMLWVVSDIWIELWSRLQQYIIAIQESIQQSNDAKTKLIPELSLISKFPLCSLYLTHIPLMLNDIEKVFSTVDLPYDLRSACRAASVRIRTLRDQWVSEARPRQNDREVDVWSESCDSEDNISTSGMKITTPAHPHCLVSSMEREKEKRKSMASLIDSSIQATKTNQGVKDDDDDDEDFNPVDVDAGGASSSPNERRQRKAQQRRVSSFGGFKGEGSSVEEGPIDEGNIPSSFDFSVGKKAIAGEECQEEMVGVRASRTGNQITGYVASWTINGFRKSLYFSMKEYGMEMARDLALLARKKATRTGKHPLREQIVALYRSLHESPNNGTDTIVSHEDTVEDDLDREHLSEDKIVDVEGVIHEGESNSWIAEWVTNGRKFHKPFSVNEFGFEGAKQRAISFRAQCVRCQTNVVGVAFDRHSSSFKANWTINGTRQSVSFSVDEFGFDEAKELAIFARRESERTGKHQDRTTILERYKRCRRKISVRVDEESTPDRTLCIERDEESPKFNATQKTSDFDKMTFDSTAAIRAYNPLAESPNPRLMSSLFSHTIGDEINVQPQEILPVDQDKTLTEDPVDEAAVVSTDEFTGVVGVNWVKHANAYAATWYEESMRDGKAISRQRVKYFSAKRFGKKQARRMAIELRQSKLVIRGRSSSSLNQEDSGRAAVAASAFERRSLTNMTAEVSSSSSGDEIDDGVERHQEPSSLKMSPSVSGGECDVPNDPRMLRGIKGTYFDKTNNVWCCTWNENSRRHRKYFSVRTFGFSEAKEKAIQMRLQKIRKDRHHRRKCNSSDEDASMSGLLSDNESSSLESNDSTNHKIGEISSMDEDYGMGDRGRPGRGSDRRRYRIDGDDENDRNVSDKQGSITTISESGVSYCGKQALSSVTGVTLSSSSLSANPCWRAIWVAKTGTRESLSFSIAEYGFDVARKLAILARQIGGATGRLGGREFKDYVSEQYNSNKQENYMDLEAKGGHGELTVKEKSHEIFSTMKTMNEAKKISKHHVPQSGVLGVTFNRFKESWNAKIGPNESLSFSCKEFGFEGAKNLAILARTKCDTLTKPTSRENREYVIALYFSMDGEEKQRRFENGDSIPIDDDVQKEGGTMDTALDSDDHHHQHRRSLGALSSLTSSSPASEISNIADRQLEKEEFQKFSLNQDIVDVQSDVDDVHRLEDGAICTGMEYQGFQFDSEPMQMGLSIGLPEHGGTRDNVIFNQSTSHVPFIPYMSLPSPIPPIINCPNSHLDKPTLTPNRLDKQQSHPHSQTFEVIGQPLQGASIVSPLRAMQAAAVASMGSNGQGIPRLDETQAEVQLLMEVLRQSGSFVKPGT